MELQLARLLLLSALASKGLSAEEEQSLEIIYPQSGSHFNAFSFVRESYIEPLVAWPKLFDKTMAEIVEGTKDLTLCSSVTPALESSATQSCFAATSLLRKKFHVPVPSQCRQNSLCTFSVWLKRTAGYGSRGKGFAYTSVNFTSVKTATGFPMDPNRKRYLHLLTKTLTGSAYPESSASVLSFSTGEKVAYNSDARRAGQDWPAVGYTMIGEVGLTNILFVLDTIRAENIPGDFLEAGVWRGGASMFALAVLESGLDFGRRVWLCDTFEGMPANTTSMDR
jgi:hypothetical protein